MRILLALFTTLFLGEVVSAEAQFLGRRASLQANVSWPSEGNPGATIRKINNDSPLLNAGVKVGDVILKVNGQLAENDAVWSNIEYSLRGNVETILEIKRGEEKKLFSVILNPIPQEKHEKLDTFYEEIVNDFGIVQRAIVTKPRKKGQLPAIILIQGLSCSSIEAIPGKSNNWMRLINDLVEKSGMVVMRVEKPGVGDSEGACSETDFQTELAGYEAAVRALKKKSFVDTTRIVVYGNSMGSALAPYLANKFNLAGIISDGTYYKSWFEHMLEIERRIMQMKGKSEQEISFLMNTVFIPLNYQMLIQKKSFEEILNANPLFREHHYQGLNHMYGRSTKFYHQLQEFNVPEHWEEVTVPVRVRWGTNDWIMSEQDNDMIIATLERRGHRNHKLVKFPNLDHWSTIHTSEQASFNFEQGKWDAQISNQIIDWAKEIVDAK